MECYAALRQAPHRVGADRMAKILRQISSLCIPSYIAWLGFNWRKALASLALAHTLGCGEALEQNPTQTLQCTDITLQSEYTDAYGNKPIRSQECYYPLEAKTCLHHTFQFGATQRVDIVCE